MTRLPVLFLFCAPIKREERKRAENSNLLQCFKCEMERGERETKIRICVRDVLKGSIICDQVF